MPVVADAAEAAGAQRDGVHAGRHAALGVLSFNGNKILTTSGGGQAHEIARGQDGRYIAVCAALQGCYTEADTEEEARTQIRDAIRLHLEDRLERGEPVYEEVGATTVRVAV